MYYVQYYCTGTKVTPGDTTEIGHYACKIGRYGNIKNASTLIEGCPFRCPPGKFGTSRGMQSEYSACSACQQGKHGVAITPTWKCGAHDFPKTNQLLACYSIDLFDPVEQTWKSNINANNYNGIGTSPATEVIEILVDSYENGKTISYIHGSLSTKFEFFKNTVIKPSYTLCSVQRYSNTGNILPARFTGRELPKSIVKSPTTWIASCANNNSYFVNGEKHNNIPPGKFEATNLGINTRSGIEGNSDWGIAFLALFTREQCYFYVLHFHNYHENPNTSNI